MLEKLKLTNFRQHKDTTIEFVRGINTIVGENNSGKSTIPEAIEFALYGSRALRDSAKGFITDGETDGKAVVRMQLSSDAYTVGRNSKNAELRKNGNLEGQYKDNVTKDVCTITGVNQTGFRLGHYVRQKELAAFSNMRPGKRHETIEKMLKVHAIDKVITRLKEEFGEIELRQKVLLNSYTDIEAVENELDDLYIVKQILSERGEKYSEQLTAINVRLTELRANQLQRTEALAKQAANTRLLDDWNKKVLLANEAISKLQETKELYASLDWSNFDAVKTQVDALHALEVKHAAMSTVKKELDKVVVAPEPVEKPSEPDRSKVQIVQTTLSLKQSQLDKLKALEGVACCPTCNQNLPDTSDIVKSLEEEISTLDQERKELNKQLAEEIAKYSTANAQYQTFVTQSAVYTETMARRTSLLENYVEVEFSKDEKIQAEGLLKSLQSIKEQAIRLEGEIAKLEALSKAPELPIVEEVTLPEDNSEVLEELNTLEKEINEFFRTQASELAHTDGRIEELTRLIEKNKEIKLAIEANSTLLSNLKAEQDSFTLFKRYLTAKIRPLLQDVAEALFHKVTKNRYASYQLGSDYEISFTTHKGYIRKLSTISGSENDLACLCLRLAIATLRSTKLAGSLGFVILDEISGSFDDERTRQTLEGLLELRDVIPQIINITHKPVEMKFADRLFTVKEVNGVAQVTY